MNLRIASLLAVALVMPLGCGANASSTLRAEARPGSARTYAFVGAPVGANATDQELRAALRHDLAGRGYAEAASAGAADFLVAYRVQEQPQLATDAVGYGFGRWEPANIITYTQAAVTVDFIDPRTHGVFWHGKATNVMQHVDGQHPRKVDRAVAKIVGRSPVS
jgi:hypothetical protein